MGTEESTFPAMLEDRGGCGQVGAVYSLHKLGGEVQIYYVHGRSTHFTGGMKQHARDASMDHPGEEDLQ